MASTDRQLATLSFLAIVSSEALRQRFAAFWSSVESSAPGRGVVVSDGLMVSACRARYTLLLLVVTACGGDTPGNGDSTTINTVGGSQAGASSSATSGSNGGSAQAGDQGASDNTTGNVTSIGGAGPVGGVSAVGGTASGGEQMGGSGGPQIGDSGGQGTNGSSGASGSGGATQMPDPVDTESLIGWATVSGMGLDGTTGGEGGETVTVSTLAELQANSNSSTPRIIQVSGDLDPGTIVVGSNTTIVGLPGAVVRGDLHMNEVENIIIQNLTIVGHNCSDDAECDGGGEDAIVVNGSHHIWFDHLDVSDGSDGNMDFASGSDFLTVSWCRFSYSETDRGHRFSNLVGSSDNNSADEGHLNVTFHHNQWADNVHERMPRTRYGQIHVFNNLYTADTNNIGVLAGFEATVLLEGNVFNGTNNPHRVAGGDLLARGNQYNGVSGDQNETGVGFTPPYDYDLESTDSVAATVMANVGPQ